MSQPARRTAAVLVAAGSGERLGSTEPKAFVPLAGEPLLAHALRAFAASALVDAYVVVAPASHVEAARSLASGLVPAGALAVCPGGATRSESVRSGLAACPADTDLVAVHDAARPLVSAACIDRAIAALEPPWEAVAPALPVVDTLKLVDGERVLRTVDRRALWGVQTPQVFRLTTLALAHQRLTGEAGPEATDDLGLIERAGGRVRVVEGERANLKVTYPEDLAVAGALLAARDAADGATT